MSLKDLYIYGAGGFGREIKMIIDQINAKKQTWNIVGFIDDGNERTDVIDSLKVIGDGTFLSELDKEADIVIAIGDSYTRKDIFIKLKKNQNLHFPNIIHPSVWYEESTLKLGQGNIFMINVIVSTCVEFGDFNVANMGAIIGHDVTVGNYTTINPGCNIGGAVSIADHCDLGLGSSVLQCISIPPNVKIGGNSLVTQRCEPHYLYLGIPAKRTLPLKQKAIK